MEPQGRIFSEKEAAAVLKRAAELSAAEGVGASGTSMSEMEHIAAEIGIRPEHVRRAVQELADLPSEPSGGRVSLERLTEGELSEEAWESVVAELRRLFGDPGTVSVVGSAREWMLRQDAQSTHISVVCRDGRTRVQLLSNHSSPVAGAWALWGIASVLSLIIATAGGAGAGGADQAILNALLVSGASGASYFWIRHATARWYDRQRRKLNDLIDRVAGRVTEGVPTLAPVPLQADSQPVEQRLTAP